MDCVKQLWEVFFIKIECIDRDKHYHINAKVLGIRWSVIQLFLLLGKLPCWQNIIMFS